MSFTDQKGTVCSPLFPLGVERAVPFFMRFIFAGGSDPTLFGFPGRLAVYLNVVAEVVTVDMGCDAHHFQI
ncbi:Uncharacterised protein [Mycobacteroides abscessus subsp. massiliense]|nr:Uncharacterised protein [Mycobacteroides abscessus subsp. massiliense]